MCSKPVQHCVTSHAQIAISLHVHFEDVTCKHATKAVLLIYVFFLYFYLIYLSTISVLVVILLLYCIIIFILLGEEK